MTEFIGGSEMGLGFSEIFFTNGIQGIVFFCTVGLFFFIKSWIRFYENIIYNSPPLQIAICLGRV